MRGGHKGLSEAEVNSLWELRSGGTTDAEIARTLGVGVWRISDHIEARGGIKPRCPAARSRRSLSGAEREEISRGIAGGQSGRSIAAAIGRDHTTVSREICLGGGRDRYRAAEADHEARSRRARPRPGKIESNPELGRLIDELLEDDFSPEQIAAHLKRHHPDNEEMQASHETIYRALFIQTRGVLRRELRSHLRTGRAKRRARGSTRRGQGRGQIVDKVMISERPAEVADRAVPGHWEGDLLKGTQTNAIATLVERKSRYCQLIALPDGYRAEPVREALGASIATLPLQLRRSLTWDQGLEMAEHVRFTVETGLPVYFCDPQSPWQRGSNENTNGLLRQYFPKGKSVKEISQAELDEVAAKLNRRPRETLGWMTPAEKLADELGVPPTPAPAR